MIGVTNAGTLRRAAFAAATLALCLPAAWGFGQHSAARPQGAPRQGNSAPHYSAPRSQPSRPQNPRQQSGRPQTYGRPNQQYPQYRAMPGPNNGFRPQAPVNPSVAARPVYPGQTYAAPGSVRPNYPRYMQPGYTPPGHLGAWLNEHRGVPVQDQERMLRSDPNFSRLPQSDQQRMVRQLNQVDQMPAPQRERRLARAEALERLSPQERAQVTDSARQWRTLAPDRQAMMKGAFQDLRAVPPDQRQMVLNSSRYQNAFSPEERGILSNMLRVEPYEPPINKAPNNRRATQFHQ